MTTYWFDTPFGISIFRFVGDLYYRSHGVYPKTLTELPEFVTSDMGVNAFPANIKPPEVPRERCGIAFEDEDATAFLLKYYHRIMN